MYRKFFKRFLDIIFATLLLLVVSPIMVLTALCLAFANGGKVFFYQPRPGKGQKIFRLIKFRTMNEEKDEEGVLLSDERRLSRTGWLVRKSSIDELPQLLNVIRGDMSLIGPRPLLEEYLPLYNKEQSRRHEVRPGITGWAQVNGRNSISWEERFRLDVWYAERVSLRLDLKILYLTLLKVFKSEGISAAGEATMPKFKGSKTNLEI